MKRFLLSADADRDLDEIEAYLDLLPAAASIRGGSKLLQALAKIARDHYLGAPHSNLTRLVGGEVRSRLASPYRIFYRLAGSTPEILSIPHTSRDLQTVFEERFQ